MAIRESLALSEEENIAALLSIRCLAAELRSISFDLFDDMDKLLVGDDRRVGCVWTACDPYTTIAVAGIDGQGNRGNCSRTIKDGIEFTKARRAGFERYISLYQTPEDCGGCEGCRFFLMCKGQCPGTSIDGDWRNKTEHCGVLKTVFETLEADLVSKGIATLSLSPHRVEVEERMVEGWKAGKNSSLFRLSASDMSTSEKARGLNV